MTLDRIGNGLKAIAARFVRAKRGNVATMFAIVLPMLLTFIGAAVDYSRMISARSSMQAAVDATALMISKEATNYSASDLTKKADAYFKALYNHSDVATANFNAVYIPNSGNGASVKIDVSGQLPTDFLKFAGYSDMTFGASTTTKWGNMRYRIALALDNTGSMDSADKMNQLKIATKKLIEDFYAMAKANEDVYVSIVPFAKDVNIGTDKVNVNWLNWSEWDSNTEKACTKPEYKKKSSCIDNGGKWVDVSEPHANWTGCVMDRTQNYDVSNVNPTNTLLDTMPLPEQYADCPVPMLGMTSVKTNKKTLLDKVDDMKPKGNTNQAIGLAWAWLTHSASGPFPAPPKDSDYDYVDAIILLTDGMNTQNRWYTNQQAPIDSRQATLCTNVKNAQMKLFAVQVATGGDSISSMLKNCTSDPSNPNYFSYVTDASQMTVKFQNIFKELAKLRVAM